MRYIPLVSQKSYIDTGQEGTNPKDQKNVRETIVDVVFIRLYADSQGEEEADDERPPQIPILETADGLLPISRDHEDCILDLGAHADNLFFLSQCCATSVSMESSSKASSLT